MNSQERLKMAFTRQVSDWFADRWQGAKDRYDDIRTPTDYSRPGMIGGGLLGAGAGGVLGSNYAESLWNLADGSPGEMYKAISQATGKPMSAYQRLIAALTKTPMRSALSLGGIGAGLGALALGGLGHDVGKWLSPEKKWYQR